MQNILVKAKNGEAEKLWNYILSYRKMMHPAKKDGVTFVVPPPLEQIKISRSKKQNSKTA